MRREFHEKGKRVANVMVLVGRVDVYMVENRQNFQICQLGEVDRNYGNYIHWQSLQTHWLKEVDGNYVKDGCLQDKEVMAESLMGLIVDYVKEVMANCSKNPGGQLHRMAAVIHQILVQV